ncbi:CapA family protein [Hellea sp.]|nr:CapA family protein [Hellea sp.]MDB4845233.1 CapA family protein [Hellea sp.]MDC0421991.1 CapA family protein [Hellea sp.]MDC1088751.1 CapA family protein [Hellea sp.]
MLSLNPSEIFPVSLPNDGIDTLGFLRPDFVKLIERQLNEVTQTDHWTHPRKVKFDTSDPSFWAYLVHKTRSPLVKAQFGSDLEAHFKMFRQSRFNLMPAGFEIEQTLTLSAVGDLMSTPPYLADAQDKLFLPVEHLIFGADIAYGNLESMLAGADKDSAPVRKSDTPYTYATRAELQSLVRHKAHTFDVLQLANNHVMDFGEDGVNATLSTLKDFDIEAVGLNPTGSQSWTITSHGDLKIGWVAHTYGLNGKPQPASHPEFVNVVDYLSEHGPDLTDVLSDIQACRENGCDLVIASVHWGAEWEFYPLPEQLGWARQFAEAGADAIIGHHPHVIQPVEIYRPRNFSEKHVPIIYSLGNLTPVLRQAGTVLALIARLKISRGRREGKPQCYFTALNLIPVATVERQVKDQNWLEIHRLADLVRQAAETNLHEDIVEMSEYATMFFGQQWRNEERYGTEISILRGMDHESPL